MKSKQIAQIKPHLNEGYLIIALEQKWIEVFNDIPSFNVIIDKNNKLNLCSVKPIKNSKKKPMPQLQEIVV